MRLNKKWLMVLTGFVVLVILVLLGFAIKAASKSISSGKQESINKSLDAKALAGFKTIYSASGQYYKTNAMFPWNNTKDDVLGSFISTSIAADSMADKLVKAGLVPKQVFDDLIKNNYNTLLISRSNLGSLEVHLCFKAKSEAYKKQAEEKCATYDSYVKSKACQPEGLFVCIP